MIEISADRCFVCFPNSILQTIYRHIHHTNINSHIKLSDQLLFYGIAPQWSPEFQDLLHGRRKKANL